MATYCGICDRRFRTYEALQQHQRDSPAHAITFDCETCNRSFQSEEALQQHQQDSPAHAITFDCETCNRSFQSEEALQQHLQNSSAHYPEETWSIHPSLHGHVSRLLQADNLFFEFHQANEYDNYIKEYDTHIMGRFVCNSGACLSKQWSSKKVAITIRLYHDKKYNAVVWHQHCQDCDSLGRPILNDTYAERVAYRLKKWSGMDTKKPYYPGKKRGPPHQYDLCEGCKNGHCKESSEYESCEFTKTMHRL